MGYGKLVNGRNFEDFTPSTTDAQWNIAMKKVLEGDGTLALGGKY